MAFWQENYGFIKDVYDWRHQKMMEWMENVERVHKIMYRYCCIFQSHSEDVNE